MRVTPLQDYFFER